MIDFELNKLPFQNAYVNTFMEDGKKGAYNLISNTQEPLGTLPATLGDKNVHPMLKMFKSCEAEAYKLGRADEKIYAKAYINEMKQRYEAVIEEMKIEQNKLADAMERLTKE